MEPLFFMTKLLISNQFKGVLCAMFNPTDGAYCTVLAQPDHPSNKDTVYEIIRNQSDSLYILYCTAKADHPSVKIKAPGLYWKSR